MNIYFAFFVPYNFSFLNIKNTIYAEYFFDGLMYIDILFTILSYSSINDKYDDSLFSLLYRYLTTWFIFDLISVFPYDLLINFEGNFIKIN